MAKDDRLPDFTPERELMQEVLDEMEQIVIDKISGSAPLSDDIVEKVQDKICFDDFFDDELGLMVQSQSIGTGSFRVLNPRTAKDGYPTLVRYSATLSVQQAEKKIRDQQLIPYSVEGFVEDVILTDEILEMRPTCEKCGDYTENAIAGDDNEIFCSLEHLNDYYS